jgi:hypothetical protein
VDYCLLSTAGAPREPFHLYFANSACPRVGQLGLCRGQCRADPAEAALQAGIHCQPGDAYSLGQ